MKGIKTTLITGFWVLAAATGLNAQLGLSWDLAKPEKFENRKLGYEKTYEKKYTLPRKFIQNTVSHYNFFFNANETVKEIFSAAKDAHKDTFSRLLDYYPYTIEQTAARKTDLDSVIIRSSGGILLHDLRTNWVDNFYLLIGIAYLLRKDYDSAIMTFNYINYEYAPKDKDGDRRIVGSNTNDGNDNNVFSISTREKRNLKTRLFERPPSRNESFIWMTRAYIEQEDFGSAAGMVQTLRNDPFFPKRLHDELDEITGYLFYRQNIYDSAAHYLVKSMSLANGRNEKARREYLAGQLYAMGNNPGLANEYFAKSVKHTLDPVMDVYARLNSIRLRKSDDPKIIDENISDLLKMARKDAYQEYRDVIYFFAAQMELERKNADAATPLLLKSVKYAGNNPGQRNQSVLALAEIAYNKKQFRNAAAWYDSLNTADPTLPNPDEILARKNNLSLLVDMLDMVQTEDSLQHVALMPPAEREDYLKKLLRRLRKEKGLKEDPNFGSGNTGAFPNRDEKPADLFNAERGEWYFYNSSLKSRGFTEFRNKWGNRPNIDGWRRSSVINQFVNSVQQRNQQAGAGNTSASKKEVTELTIDALMANLPISDSAMAISNDTIQSALFGAAKLYQYNFEDYERAIETWEDLLKRYPGGKNNEEALFNLYQCYMKTGQTDKAAAIKNRIGKEFPAGKLLSIINNPGQKPASENTAATKLYEQIYNLFIEGKFEEALQQKQQADAQYGNSFWTPQLLYIEAVYHIKQRNDSAARPALENIINLHPNSPMNARAQTLLDVLSRRAQIEEELASLQVARVADDPVVFDTGTAATPKPPVTNPNPPVVNNPVKPVTPPVTNNPPPVTNPNPPAVTPPKPKYAYKHNPDGQHYAGIVLEKVDNIFSNEARNSFIIFNRSVGRVLQVNVQTVTNDHKLLLVGPFNTSAEALDYVQRAKEKASTEIIPWLDKAKYSFVVIAPENLPLLKDAATIADYKAFLGETWPGKF